MRRPVQRRRPVSGGCIDVDAGAEEFGRSARIASLDRVDQPRIAGYFLTPSYAPLLTGASVASASPRRLCPMATFAYAGVMYATAVVGGKVVRFKLSPALARAHRQNRGKAMTEAEAVAVVEAKRRARALRRARPYLASRP
jgi:hypothetical protein